MENSNIAINNPYKQFLNKNFLKKIDEEWKAYFLGWIWSDGHVSNEAVVLKISEKDRYVLDFFNNCIYNGLRDIRIYNPGKNLKSKNDSLKSYACFKIYCTEIVRDLRKMGITRLKTFNLPFPNLEPQYIPAFIRGFFDGDGCAFFNGRKNKSLGFYCGTESFLEKLKTTLESLGIKGKISKRKNIFQLYIYDHSSIFNFYKAIYDNECCCLPRKKAKIESMIKSSRSKYTSKNKYIHFSKSYKKWLFRYKKIDIGKFKTEEEAVLCKIKFLKLLPDAATLI